jgi:hypothetical protein
MKTETDVPSIVPARGGSVLLEWHTPIADLELQVSPQGRVQVYFEEFDSNEAPYSDEGTADELIPNLRKFIDHL